MRSGENSIKSGHAKEGGRLGPQNSERLESPRAFGDRDGPPPCVPSREILIPARSVAELPPLWVCIRTLRLHGCEMQIRVMVPDAADWADGAKKILASISGVAVEQCTPKKNEWSETLVGILGSKCDEVLVLSPHTVAVRDPSDLFDAAEFRKTGIVVWPRFSAAVDRSELCRRLEIEHRSVSEIEDSQFLVSRVGHEATLRKALELAQEGWVTDLLWGNVADTVKFALYCLKREFAGIRTRPRPLLSHGSKDTTAIAAMCYFDTQEEQVFQNRKWSPFRLNNSPEIAGSLFDPFARKCLGELRAIWTNSVFPERFCFAEQWLGEWLLDGRTGFLDGAGRVVILSGQLVEGLEGFGVEFWTSDGDALHLLDGKMELLVELSPIAGGIVSGMWKKSRTACRMVRGSQLMTDDAVVAFYRAESSRAGFIEKSNCGSDTLVHVLDHSGDLAEAVAALNACCGLAEDGFRVLFHTPLFNWFYRIDHPGVGIAHNTFPAFEHIDYPAGGPRIVSHRSDGGQAVRWTCEISAADEKSKRLGVGSKPRPPATVDRVPKSRRLDFTEYVVIVPFSQDRTREWPAAHWNRLIFLLRAEGFDVVAVGMEDYAERFTNELGQSHAFWASGEAAEWMLDVLLSASAMIAPDCGLAHLAVAHQVRTVCLVSEFPAGYFFPESAWEIVSGESDCIHCWRKPEKGFAPVCNISCSALSAITPEAVFRQFKATK